MTVSVGVRERVSEQAYLEVALRDPSRRWELHDGQPREKPAMSIAHNRLAFRLGVLLQEQLGWEEFVVGVNGGRVRHSETRVYIPDVFVAPAAQAQPLWDQMEALEVYADPLPLVVEVWSPSTGGYDVNEKLAEYQRRGDREIWRIHPRERTLTAWCRQPDGSYTETVYREGVVRPASLPGVAIELAALFAVIG